MSSPVKLTTALRNATLLAGVQKRFPTLNIQSFPVGGSLLSLAQIEAELQPIVNAGNAVPPASAAWHQAVQAQKTADAEGASFLADLRAAIYTLFGNQAEVLADFGLLPKKAHKTTTTAIKVVAAAKRKATRAARGYIKPTQKKTLKGTVGAVIEIPVPGATVPPPAPSPAPTSGAISPQATGAAVLPPRTNGSSTAHE